MQYPDAVKHNLWHAIGKILKIFLDVEGNVAKRNKIRLVTHYFLHVSMLSM